MYCDSKSRIHFCDDDDIIRISVQELQKLVKKHFGKKLSDKELEALSRIFNTDLSRVDDGGWEGIVGNFIGLIISAIRAIKLDYRTYKPIIKDICYSCGYYDKRSTQFYKCHAGDCPART